MHKSPPDVILNPQDLLQSRSLETAEDRLSPSHKIRQETSNETSLYDTQKFTVLRHKNWSCKYTKDMYCDSDDNNVILLPAINTFCTCQADADTKMTIGMFMCITQNGEMCTVVYTIGTSTCLSLVQTTLYEDDLVQQQRRRLVMNRSV